MSLSPANPRMRSGQSMLPLLWIVPAVVSLMVNIDTDIWHILNNGRWVLSNGFYGTEPFTVHAGMSYIPQQLLSDVLFYLSYRFGGMGGVVFLSSLTFLMIWVLASKTMEASGAGKAMSVFVPCLLSVPCAMFCCTRPWLFSGLLLETELLCLARWRNGKRRSAFFLPLIACALVNFHMTMYWMSFILAMPFAAEAVLCFIRSKDVSPLKSIAASLALCLHAGLLNPYGIKAPLIVFRATSAQTSGTVVEMRPILPGIPVWSPVFLACFILFISAVLIRDRGRWMLSDILLCLGTVFMGILHLRMSFFVFLAAPVFLASSLPVLTEKKRIPMLLYAVPAAAWLAAAISMAYSEIPGPLPEGLEEAVASISEKDSGEGVYTDYECGAYAEWEGLRCSFDARAEVFLYPMNGQKDYFEEWHELIFGELDIGGYLDRYGLGYAITDDREEIRVSEFLSESPGWRLIEKTAGISAWERIK